MQIIQPHYHAIARTAQDYERMAMSGVVAVCEPAFWAGYDRRYPETFIRDYFAQISEFEPTRAAEFGIVTSVGLRSIPKKRKTKNSLTRSFASCGIFQQAQLPGCRGDRTAQVHPERNRILAGSRRHGDEAWSTRPYSYAASCRQGPWYQDRSRSLGGNGRGSEQDMDRSCRGTDHRIGFGCRVLGGNDTLPEPNAAPAVQWIFWKSTRPSDCS